MVGRQSSSRYDAVQVGMRLQGLSPGMQDAEESDLRTEMFGVGGHFQQGGRRGLEQESKQDLLILPDQRHEAVRHAEEPGGSSLPAGVPAAADAATSPGHGSDTSGSADYRTSC